MSVPAQQQILGMCTSKDSDHPGHPNSLTSVFTRYSTGSQDSNDYLYEQQVLLIYCVDVQADLSLRWADLPNCTFCCALSHMLKLNVSTLSGGIQPSGAYLLMLLLNFCFLLYILYICLGNHICSRSIGLD